MSSHTDTSANIIWRIIWRVLVHAAIVIGAFCLSCAAVSAEGDVWKQAVASKPWHFPRDHGAHPDYRTEWWYFTGNLVDERSGRHGYQLTFFRHGLRRAPQHPENPWSVRDVYLAHFAVSDGEARIFRFAQLSSRDGPDLAGASVKGMDVRCLNWSARMKGKHIFLNARKDGMELRLQLTPRKPPVFHGAGGLSKKGSEEGQATYYYSFTDLETKGLITLPHRREPLQVTGTSWFDQEFGSNQLSKEQTGWDWFSIHLSDGREIMIYFLRRKDGALEPASSGTLIETDGRFRHMKLSDIAVEARGYWKSPRSGAMYPARWHVSIPSAQIEIALHPLVADQELNTEGTTGVIYWEGAVEGRGASGGKDVTCRGYVEMTGYAGSMGGLF